MRLAIISGEAKRAWLSAQLNRYRVCWASDWKVLEIRRDNILGDSYDHLTRMTARDLHVEFQIKFVGEETTQDAGGVRREWFELLIERLFDPDNGLFALSDTDLISYGINSQSHINELHLEYFKFAGRILGKALFDSTVLSSPLSVPLVKQLLGKPVDRGDLLHVDIQLFKSLEWMEENDVSNVIFETFSVEDEFFSARVSTDLIADGSNVAVTNVNKHEYIQLRALHRLESSIAAQLEQMRLGLWEVVPLSILSLFDVDEFSVLLNGNGVLDLRDWKAHTVYRGVYTTGHPVVEWFWEVITDDLTAEERCKLLQFATGTPRVPAGGFKNLQSSRGRRCPFTVQSVESSDSRFTIPKAHTCFNRIDLPIYESKGDLLKGLNIILKFGTVGFGIAN
eukprot:GHVO01040162.1.p1 GENE.GHVO01040162.1~~GHVO01040162.1.p1  ORF type:complete len:395 (-),score=65.16 GHVO01040162.1:265-1449(-)